MMRLLRLAKIWLVSLKYGLDEFLTGHERFRAVRPLARALTFWRDTSAPRAVRLRQALETLGPIFVKFGQILSTRRDLLPLDIADELAKLQDRVPPFGADLAVLEIERSLGKKIQGLFASFEREPVASASIAQVHLATLHDGREVAVKVLRPGVESAIARDVALLDTAAGLAERHPEGRRLKPREVVGEFTRHLEDEL